MPRMTLVIAWLLLFGWSASATVMFQSFADSASIEPASLSHQALREWVVIMSEDEAGDVALWDLQVVVTPGTRVIAGTSSELLFLAVLRGSIVALSTNSAVKAGPLTIKAGEALFAGHDAAGGLRRAPYSVDILLRTLEQAGRTDLAEGLDLIAARQQRKMAWGLLRTTRLNIAAPLRPGPENLRKTYLNQPEIMAARRGSATPPELAHTIAARFLEGLARQDADAVANLISPRSFEDAVQAGVLTEIRLSFARDLLKQPWVSHVDAAGMKASEFLPLAFEFTSGEERYEIHLEPFDATYFVKSVLPLIH